MVKFKLGDIVKYKLLGENCYYVITDIANYTQEDDEHPEIECEIALIYPISNLQTIETIGQDELEMVAEFKSRDYILLMDYIQKERERKGRLPSRVEPVIRDGEKEIRKILEDNGAEIQTELFVGKMNTHLELLLNAINEKDKKEIKFHKEKLEEIRKKLMELEYFQLEQRRNGVSIRIK